MPSSDYSSVVEQRPVSRSTHLTGGPPEKDQQLRCPRYVHHFNGVGGSFASLLNPQPSPTLLAYNGFGLGHGSAFDEMVTFENKGMVWPLGFGENTHSGGIGLIGGGIGNTWQLGIGGAGGDASGGGGGDGDFFTWPELGMSTPRKGVK
ncbi:hypothetical protein FRX31_022434 [Thalictrum thalictroides]|uniref:Uncharacterized protein n=1 Tax=Thalictrum thalictroides TaxID=46969 RepID=A0A7J6VSB6_THATH|nr:hypothetical protein FRX31_022434 [Thalictrum thalictroides]